MVSSVRAKLQPKGLGWGDSHSLDGKHIVNEHLPSSVMNLLLILRMNKNFHLHISWIAVDVQGFPSIVQFLSVFSSFNRTSHQSFLNTFGNLDDLNLSFLRMWLENLCFGRKGKRSEKPMKDLIFIVTILIIKYS